MSGSAASGATYVGDASQALARLNTLQRLGRLPEPSGYTDDKDHAYFEGEFVKGNLSRAAFGLRGRTVQVMQLRIEEEMRTLVLSTLGQVEA